MKRVLLLIATNLAVMVVLSIVVSVLGFDRWLSANGIDYFSLLVFSAIFGFGGAFISLLMSKFIAKMSVGAQVIDGSEGTTQYFIVQTVHKLADPAHIGRPEVAIYEGPANAFSTGAFRDSAPRRTAALARRGGLQRGGLPDSVKACGLSSASGRGHFSPTPPPIEARIAALQNPS